jgi:hypothetical protein
MPLNKGAPQPEADRYHADNGKVKENDGEFPHAGLKAAHGSSARLARVASVVIPYWRGNRLKSKASLRNATLTSSWRFPKMWGRAIVSPCWMTASTSQNHKVQ